MGYVIDDKRSEEDKKATIGFIVAMDSFMSGWGGAKGRSLFAVPFRSWEESDIVFDNMKDRKEMKRARQVKDALKIKLYSGDHLSIRAISEVSNFYRAGGFRKQVSA